MSVPHVGVQAAPPAVRFQERPALLTSFEIVAEISVTGPPAVCEANLFVMLTLMGGKIWKLKTNACRLSAFDRAVIVAC